MNILWNKNIILLGPEMQNPKNKLVNNVCVNLFLARVRSVQHLECFVEKVSIVTILRIFGYNKFKKITNLIVAFIDMLQLNFAHSSPILVFRCIYAVLLQIHFFAVLRTFSGKIIFAQISGKALSYIF